MNSDSLLHRQHQQIPPYRSLQHPSQQLHHGPPHLPHHTLASQSDLDLGHLDDNSSVYHGDLHRLQSQSHSHGYHAPNGYDHGHGQGPRHVHPQSNGNPHTPQHGGSSQFGILTPSSAQHSSISRLQQDGDMYGSPDAGDQSSNGHLPTAIVPDPPNLAEWRQKLFNVDEMITLSEDEFQTYFPHVDNVYSHRSTQRYKRKLFISHYWDCRLKGRPPGTPKSEDPNKKKRKRTARERDLCDVKIKITEYFPGAMLHPDFVPDGAQGPEGTTPGGSYLSSGPLPLPAQPPFGLLSAYNGVPSNHPGRTGQRFYTIQRVNGNGGNGKGDGVPGPHKHTLDVSDRVKKSTVQRFLAKRDKEDKKTQKTYHKKATGSALATVKKHSKEHDLKLFGSCFCPFVQRVWIALEAKGIQYQYIEVDPYKKPQALLDVNPRGLVPGLRHGDWGCGESNVLMEYLEDLGAGTPLLPVGDARSRANCRLWSDHINRHIIPAFYALLQEQEFEKHAQHTEKLQSQIAKLVDASDAQGPFFLGPHLSFVDIQLAPWMLRCSRVLKQYRAWPDPEPGSRWARWIEAVEANEHVRATTSSDDLYTDSYERYAQNRPGTSQLADAVNGGYELP